jgi:flagellin
MRINHNMLAANASRQLSVNSSAQQKSLQKLSSGLAINSAADNAAGLSISERMRAGIADLNQSSANAQDGISQLQTNEGGLNEVSAMLVRMSELTVERANGTYSTEDQANIDAETTELGGEMASIATSSLGTIDVAVSGSDTKTTIGVLATDCDISAVTGAAAGTLTSTAINTAITLVDKTRSTLGAQINKLQYASDNLKTTSENTQSAESRIRDTDMASEMANFNKYNILVQASTSMLSQANSSQQNILSLFR